MISPITSNNADPKANIAEWIASGIPFDWAHSHLSGWNQSDWINLLDSIKATPYWPMEQRAMVEYIEMVRKILRMLEDEKNFLNWSCSPVVCDWVRKHSSGWDQAAWQELLHSLRKSQYWPMDDAKISRFSRKLEAARNDLQFKIATRTEKPTDDDLSDLIKKLTDVNPSVRVTALRMLIDFCVENALNEKRYHQVLDVTYRLGRDRLPHHGTEYGRNIVEILKKCDEARISGRPSEVERLFEILHQNWNYNRFVYKEFARLVAIGTPAVNRLIEALQQSGMDRSWLKDRIIETLAAIGNPNAVEPLCALLCYYRGNESCAAHDATTHALVKLQDPRGIEAIYWALRQPNQVALVPAAALVKINDKRTLRELPNAFRHEDWRVRAEACKAFGAIASNLGFGEPFVFELLSKSIKSADQNVRDCAVRVIEKQASFRQAEEWKDAARVGNFEKWRQLHGVA